MVCVKQCQTKMEQKESSNDYAVYDLWTRTHTVSDQLICTLNYLISNLIDMQYCHKLVDWFAHITGYTAIKNIT